jgi:hypothetical protein
VIRRLIAAVLGLALALSGLAFFGAWMTAEPGFGPQSSDMAVAYVVLGIVLGASGIWLIRFSLRREGPGKSA